MYNRVTIIGPDHNHAFTSDIREARQEASSDSEHYLVIGDGEREVTEQEIRDALKDKIGPETHVQLLGHGDQTSWDNRIVNWFKGQSSEHSIQFSHQKWYDLYRHYKYSTSGIIKILNECSNNQGFQIYLKSCHGGAANSSMEFAAPNSGMITVAEPSDVSFGTPFLFKDSNLSIQDTFFQNLRNVFETTTLSIKQADGKIIHFTYRPCNGQVVWETESIKRYNIWAQEKFIEWCDDNGIILQNREVKILSEPEAGSILNQYIALALVGNDKLTEDLDLNNLNKIQYGATPLLYWGCHFGARKSIKSMIKAGVDVNAKNIYGSPLLYEFALVGNAMAMENLLKVGADPNIKLSTGETVLSAIIDRNNLDCLSTLLKYKADPNTMTKAGNPLIYNPIVNNKVEAVKILLKAGADPNVADKNGMPLILKAALEHKSEIVEALKYAGADLKVLSPEGTSPILYAACHGDGEAVQILKNVGASPNEMVMGHSPLYWTLQDKANSNENLPDTCPVEPICPMKEQAQNLLLGIGAKAEAKLLFSAALNNKPETVNLLIKAGADPNVPDENGVLILLLAALENNSEAVKLLVDVGADPNIEDEEGKPMLFEAIEKDNPEAVKLLLDAGASAGATYATKTSIEYAKECNVSPTIMTLINEALKLTPKTVKKAAVNKESFSYVKRLKEQNAKNSIKPQDHLRK